MTNKKLIDDLQNLLADEDRTKIGRVREIYDEIEKLKLSGVSLRKIVSALNSPEHNFRLTENLLKCYMYKIKKERSIGETDGEKINAKKELTKKAKELKSNPAPPIHSVKKFTFNKK
jgi:poly(A) polymerase Pap1